MATCSHHKASLKLEVAVESGQDLSPFPRVGPASLSFSPPKFPRFCILLHQFFYDRLIYLYIFKFFKINQIFWLNFTIHWTRIRYQNFNSVYDLLRILRIFNFRFALLWKNMDIRKINRYLRIFKNTLLISHPFRLIQIIFKSWYKFVL